MTTTHHDRAPLPNANIGQQHHGNGGGGGGGGSKPRLRNGVGNSKNMSLPLHATNAAAAPPGGGRAAAVAYPSRQRSMNGVGVGMRQQRRSTLARRLALLVGAICACYLASRWTSTREPSSNVVKAPPIVGGEGSKTPSKFEKTEKNQKIIAGNDPPTKTDGAGAGDGGSGAGTIDQDSKSTNDGVRMTTPEVGDTTTKGEVTDEAGKPPVVKVKGGTRSDAEPPPGAKRPIVSTPIKGGKDGAAGAPADSSALDGSAVRGELRVFRPTPSDPSRVHTLGAMMIAPSHPSVTILQEVADASAREEFLRRHGAECYTPPNGGGGGDDDNLVLERYREMGGEALRVELWKYCALYVHGGAFFDGDGVLLQTLGDALLSTTTSTSGGGGADDDPQSTPLRYDVAPLSNVYPRSIHGSILALRRPRDSIAGSMIAVLMETDDDGLLSGDDPLMLSRTLHDLIAARISSSSASAGDGTATQLVPGTYANAGWRILEHTCHFDPLPNGGGVNPPHQSGGNLADVKEEAPWGEPAQKTAADRGGAGSGLPAVTLPRYHRITQHCPTPNDYCCSITSSGNVVDGGGGRSDASSATSVVAAPSVPLFLTHHPIFPYRAVPPVSSLPQPYLHASAGEGGGDGGGGKDGEGGAPRLSAAEEFRAQTASDLPYISTVRATTYDRPKDQPPTPNFFDLLHENDCLPSDKECSTCLRNKKGSDCSKCAAECPCFCKALCDVRPPTKFLSKRVVVRPPVYPREVDRLIPRIVHQTWFEPVTTEKYPNMSRLIQSWKQSGWEYRFYDDAAIENFLSTHFPPEVRQAYDSLIPGAFKADLFRYCVLLIDGGVYADMDVLLESNLEVAIPADAGFVTPVDEPGSPVDHRMCLWNGLIGSAPAHPFLARVIEIVVNNIRNRFTSVDVDDMLCPPTGDKAAELSVSHAFDTLFTAGPCVLGMAINDVLGRDLQKSFADGEIKYKSKELRGGVSTIPGRSIILRQDKQDMGAHRFTLAESNLVVAATDMPDYDDRQNIKKEKKSDDKKKDGGGGGGGEHYSKVHVKVGVYGLNGLYREGKSANEDIKISVETTTSSANADGDGARAEKDQPKRQ